MKVDVYYKKVSEGYKVYDAERHETGRFAIIDEATFARMKACEFIRLIPV